VGGYGVITTKAYRAVVMGCSLGGLSRACLGVRIAVL
jgi:hypothetical protein